MNIGSYVEESLATRSYVLKADQNVQSQWRKKTSLGTTRSSKTNGAGGTKACQCPSTEQPIEPRLPLARGWRQLGVTWYPSYNTFH